MSNILERLALRRRHETTLATGLKVAFHYPDLTEFLEKVGELPTPALNGKEPTEVEAIAFLAENPEAATRFREVERLTIETMLDAVDGTDIEPTDDRSAIWEMLAPVERRELFLIATRQKDPVSGEA